MASNDNTPQTETAPTDAGAAAPSTGASDSPSGMFDRFIEHFSARDLKKRVWGIVFMGFVLLGIAGFAGWWLLTHEFFVADEPGLEKVRLIRLLTKGL